MIKTVFVTCVLPLLAPGGQSSGSFDLPATLTRVAAPEHTRPAPPAAVGAGTQPTVAPTQAQEPDLSFWDFTNTRDALRPTRFGLSVGGGVGMIRTGSPYTLRRGELATAANGMNFDRYPGDVDIVEAPLQFALGLTDSIEVFFRFSPKLRTNSVGQDPLNWPVPPLDLFVDVYPSNAARTEPYFMYAQEFPYKTYPYQETNIDPPGNGAFAVSTGDNVFGAKFNLLSEDRGAWAGFGIRAYVEVPTEMPAYNNYAAHRERAGSAGEIDYGIDLLMAKKRGAAELLFNLGYKHVGDPDRGLRIQLVDSGAGAENFIVGEPIEAILDLRNEAYFHFGITFPMFEFWRQKGELWFIGELSYTRYVGPGTPTERLVHPLEMRLGAQYGLPFARSVSFGFAWQLMFNDAGDGSLRGTNFNTPDGRGDINFGELVDPDLAAVVEEYFRQRGATFSDDSGRVFATNNPAFDSWRNVSAEPQTVIGQGGGAALFYITWRIAQLW